PQRASHDRHLGRRVRRGGPRSRDSRRVSPHDDPSQGRLGPMTTPQPEEPVRDSVRKYAALRPSLVAPTQQALELVTSMLDEAGINYLSVSSRTKSVASFAAKAARVLEREPEADPLGAITDQIGVRVITYV